MGLLALVFIVLPIVDLWLLFVIGDAIGFWPAFGLTVGSALLGAFLGKREGIKVLRAWGNAIAEMRVPEEGIVSGALILAGAVLLVLPGVLTDVLGLVLLAPPTRRLIAARMRDRLRHRFARAVQEGRVQVNVSVQGSVLRAGRFEVVDPDVIDTVGESLPDEAEPPKLLPQHARREDADE